MNKFVKELKELPHKVVEERNGFVPTQLDHVNYYREDHLISEFKFWIERQKQARLPDYVAEYLKMRKEKYPIGGLGAAITDVFDRRINPDLFNWMNSNVEVFADAWLYGYEISETRFYLKNKITKGVLVYDDSPELSEVSELLALSEFELENYTFTQEEIEEMEIGSYEKIEVK